MEIFNSIVDSIKKNAIVVESIVEAASDLVASSPSNKRLGLVQDITERNVQVRKGDLILDADEHSVYIATGEYSESGNPVVAGKGGVTKSLEPEFVIIGVSAADDNVRRASGRLATKYPDRRVLAYGSLPRLGESSKETTSGSSVKNDKDPWHTWMVAGNKKPEKDKKVSKKKVPAVAKKKSK